MPMKVEKVALWCGEIEDKPGALAKVLEPLAAAGVDLQVVLAERNPAKPGSGTVYLAPIKGRKATDAAKSVGLSEATTPTLLRVEGTNKPGLGHLMTSALAEAGINLSFAAAAVLGNKFVAFFGFDSDADARKASRILSALKIPRR
ncbi:MAG: amino acid-binding protein [Candidatus Fervidibacterota bacterium]